MGIFWFLVLISFGAFTTGITLMDLSEAIGSGMHGQLETLIVANFIVTYFLIWLGNLIFQLSLKKRFEKLEAKISNLHRDLRKGLEMNGDIMKRNENSIVPSSGALDVDVENITNQAELEEFVKTTTN